MRRHPAASLVSLLAVSCIAAPIAEDQAETDQISAGNYAWSANKDAWTEYLSAPSVDMIVQDEWAPHPGLPGCAVGIVQGGETIYLKGYGLATDWGQPWSYQTVAPVGSIAKTITALSLHRLRVERPELDIDIDDLFADHSSVISDFDDNTLRQILSHSAGAPSSPNWDPGSPPDTCVGDCEYEHWDITRPRVAFSMAEAFSAAEVPKYSNLSYTAIGSIIDEYTHDAAWLDPDERGYEAYTWHRVGRFEANDTYKGQMLTLALTHSWRVDNLEWQYYAHGTNYGTGAPLEAWDEITFEGWEGPSGGWVMTIGDLARLIEGLDKNDIVTAGSLNDMATEASTLLGGYGQGIIIENAPPEDDAPGPGGAAPEVPDGGTPELPDHTWWHGGDIGGHTAVWAYWPDLETEEGKDTFGVALICNRRDDDHSAVEQLMPVAREIKDLYLTSGITIWNSQEIAGLATLEEVDDRDYLLDLTHATIVDPPSFYVPLDQLEERVWVSVDQVGTKASLAMVQGDDPNSPNADVTALGTWTFTPGKTIHAGVGADTSIAVAGVGDIDLYDVRLSTAFNKHGTALAGAKLGATIDLRQIDDLADDGWVGMCSDLAREASCKPCDDRVQACLEVTIGYLEGADQ